MGKDRASSVLEVGSAGIISKKVKSVLAENLEKQIEVFKWDIWAQSTVCTE